MQFCIGLCSACGGRVIASIPLLPSGAVAEFVVEELLPPVCLGCGATAVVTTQPAGGELDDPRSPDGD